MQIQAITYFNELVKCRSIREAAKNLGVTPTAIGRQLDNLEYHFGVVLVERGAKGIELTAAGEVVAERLLSASRAFGQARQAIDDLRGLRTGEVSVYVNGAASGSVLSAPLAEFSIKYPSVKLRISETSAQAALDAVAQGEADMALTMFSPSDARIKSRCQVPLPYCAIFSPDHPAASAKEIGLDLLSQYPLTLPDTSYSLRMALDERMRLAGKAPLEATFTTPSMTVQKEVARLGATILILPEVSVRQDIELNRLIVRPLAADARVDTFLKLGLAKDLSLSFAADKFAHHLELSLLSQFQGGS
ncbi:LysR family transcriptional regulator [Roseibium algae]|uniref:LysR family transcriptional regulator n=1 Tax=Roseibium algae TaxID=3123038 RepID=A0ABU8TNG9_9HYPH